MVEADSSQRLIDMQAGDFAEARETSDRHIVEEVHMLDFLGIAETAQDTVIEDCADSLGLVAGIRAQIAGKRGFERLAF